jgi:hypothetical protein
MTGQQLNKVKNLVNERVKGVKGLQHGFLHLVRVAYFAKKIVETLNVESKIDLNLLFAACYLHDVDYTFYPPGLLSYFLEKRRLKKVLPKVLAQLDIEISEKAIIENAIYKGPFSFPFKKLNRNGDLYTKILQDADTLDFFSEQRVKDFEKSKKKVLFYALAGLISDFGVNYGRKNIANYLNFPQIAKESYVPKS